MSKNIKGSNGGDTKKLSDSNKGKAVTPQQELKRKDTPYPPIKNPETLTTSVFRLKREEMNKALQKANPRREGILKKYNAGLNHYRSNEIQRYNLEKKQKNY